jgi:hypothetical protein
MEKKTEKEYTPYGPEWEKEMMKFTKKGLIEFLRKVLTSKLKAYGKL